LGFTPKVRVTLVRAENSRVRIDGSTGERIDLEKQHTAEAAATAERERIAAKKRVERDRIAAEQQAKEDAAEAVRQKRLAAERKEGKRKRAFATLRTCLEITFP
jgi:sRNA-binding protein